MMVICFLSFSGRINSSVVSDQNMIDFALTTPIDDVEIHHFPIEIISEILQQVNPMGNVLRCKTAVFSISSKNLTCRNTFMRMSLLH